MFTYEVTNFFKLEKAEYKVDEGITGYAVLNGVHNCLIDFHNNCARQMLYF